MAEYSVINDFADLQDNHYIYKKGDGYPRTGAKSTDERISFLLAIHKIERVPITVEAIEIKDAAKPQSQPQKKSRRQRS